MEIRCCGGLHDGSSPCGPRISSYPLFGVSVVAGSQRLFGRQAIWHAASHCRKPYVCLRHVCDAGAAGGVAGIIAGQPLDVVRVRLQQKSSHTKSLASMWQLIVRQEGMRSLFKGAAYPITTIAMQVGTLLTLSSNHFMHCIRKVASVASSCTYHGYHAPSLSCNICQMLCMLFLQNAVVFYSYGVGCRWLASKDSTRAGTKEPLKLWQVYAAGMRAACHQCSKRYIKFAG